MSIFYYFIGYIVLSIAIAYYLKKRKNSFKPKISFIRRNHNDYMNDPKFSYMSCNKYNPESAFFKKPDDGKKCNCADDDYDPNSDVGILLAQGQGGIINQYSSGCS